MKKLASAIGIVLAITLVSFFTLNNYIYDEKQASPEEVAQSFEPYRATLSGEFVCLPHVDAEGPQTDECALGIKTETSEYYATDFSLMSQTPPELSTGDRFKASGTVTPIERLSTDHWRQYPVEGIFSVTDSVEKL
jgi:hypothetical protein